jgi:hypothetical protein
VTLLVKFSLDDEKGLSTVRELLGLHLIYQEHLMDEAIAVRDLQLGKGLDPTAGSSSDSPTGSSSISMTSGSDGANGELAPEPRARSALPALAPEPRPEGLEGADGRLGPEPWAEGSGEVDGCLAPGPEVGSLLLAYPGSL